jgi:hypothetical protein
VSVARFLGLEGVVLVPAPVTRATDAHLCIVFKARGVMCVHGRVGLGGIVCVGVALRDFAPGRLVMSTSRKLAWIREASRGR